MCSYVVEPQLELPMEFIMAASHPFEHRFMLVVMGLVAVFALRRSWNDASLDRVVAMVAYKLHRLLLSLLTVISMRFMRASSMSYPQLNIRATCASSLLEP